MADENEDIVQRIILQGAAEVIAQLRAVSDAANAAASSINKQQSQQPGPQSPASPQQKPAPSPTPKLSPQEERESFNAIEIFRRSVHSLHPALREAGIASGELSGLMMAARGGIGVLSVAIGGLLVAALEKAGDAANDASNRIGAFTGSAEKGKEGFAKLEGPSRELGTTPERLAGPYEQLLRSSQRQQLPEDKIVSVLTTLVKGAQADRVPIEKLVSGITELLASVRKEGQLSPEALKTASELMPQLMKSVIEELNKIKPPGQITTTAPQFFQAVSNAGPKVDRSLEATRRTFPEGIGEAWEHTSAAASRLEKSIAGGSVIANTLNKLADFFDLMSQAVDKVKAANQKFFGKGEKDQSGKGEKDQGVHPFSNEGTQSQFPALQKLQAPSGSTGAARSFSDELDTIKGAFRSFNDELSTIKGAFDGAGSSIEKLVAEFEANAERLSSIGKALNLAKAELDKEFEPKETDIKLRKEAGADKAAGLAIKSAEINAEEAKKRLEESHLAAKSAQLNKEEAEKGVKLAQFAIGDAQQKSDDAALNLRQARLNASTVGGPLSREDREEQQDINRQKAIAARKAAEEAKAKADIEAQYAYLEPQKAEYAAQKAGIQSRYAYLEPQKAQVDVEKTQAEITSAKLEKEDTSLKLAKDERGAPLAHEYSILRYAQAQLDVQKDLLKTGQDGKNSLKQIAAILQEILNVLGGKKPETSETPETPKAPGDETTIPGKAAGGLLGGRPGRDTNLGWFTKGEFVITEDGRNLPEAIAHYASKFSEGGLVDYAIPRFAEGGPVLSPAGAGLHPVPIYFNGQHLGTLQGSSSAVAEMHQAAVTQQVSSLGPKPSHYK